MYYQEVKHKYLKRTFLAPASSGLTSHILAEVEDSQNGEYKFGNYLLTIADCKHRIQLEFLLGSRRSRKQSLVKINLLLETLARFGHAVMTEAELIEKFEKNGKPKAKAKTSRK